MAEQTPKLTSQQIADIVRDLNAIADHAEQCKFYHAHPEIHGVIRGIHYPKPSVS